MSKKVRYKTALVLDSKDLVENFLNLVAVIDCGERVLPEPVAEAKHGDASDVLNGDLRPSLEGTEGLRGTVGHEVPAEPIDVEGGAQLRDLHTKVPFDRDVLEPVARLLQAVLDGGLRILVGGPEGGGAPSL